MEAHEASKLSAGDYACWSALLEGPLEQCTRAGACYSPPPKQEQFKEDLGARQRTFAQRLQALVSGDAVWSSTDPVMQKMMRELDPQTKDELKRKSKQEQQEFRRKWGEEHLKELVETKVFLQEHQRIDVSLGTYMSASKIFQEEGGTAEDVEPTQRLLRKKAPAWLAACPVQRGDRALRLLVCPQAALRGVQAMLEGLPRRHKMWKISSRRAG